MIEGGANNIIISSKEGRMYTNRDKIVKKEENAKTTEIEDEVAKALFELENSTKDEMADAIKKIKFASASYVEDEHKFKVLLIVVPFPLYGNVKKSYGTTLPYLENKFQCPVLLVAQRKILSKYGKSAS